MHVLGIDAGGTKTACLLADERGTILADVRSGGANLHTNGAAAVERVLRDVIDAATKGTAEVDAICVGMAGVDRADEVEAVTRMIRGIVRARRVLVVNDAHVALAAGSRGEPGIVIIAGTGSIAYGRNPEGESARAGGWGHMIGDEGSGYWIGREALSAVMRASDRRGPDTALTAGVLRHFDVADLTRLPHLVYDREQPRMNVAALGPLVQEVADQGDAVAADILDRATEELALAARAVAERLEMRGDKFRFYLSGGAFRVVPWLAAKLPALLAEVAPRSTTELLDVEPAMGAVWLAIADANRPSAAP